MKPKTLILMVVAVVCGLGASYMTSRLLAERGDSTDENKVFILVAKKNLDIGTQIKKPEDMFQPKTFIKGQEPKNAIVKLEELKDRQVKRPLREGDWVTTADLLEPGAALGVANSLPKGMRAVGLRVNMEGSAAGFANLPMSRVDIVSTVRRGGDSDSFSQVLLENVLVLAADTETKRDPEGRAMPAGVVTVALTPADALKVTLGREIGTLTLLLRNYKDNDRVDAPKVTVANIITNDSSRRKNEIDDSSDFSAKPAPPPPPAVAAIPDIPNAPAPKLEPVVVEPQTYTHVITIIEGDSQRKQPYVFDRNTHTLVNQDVARSPVGFQPQPLPPVTPAPAQQQPEAAPVPPVPPAPPAENRPQPPQSQVQSNGGN